MKNRRSVSIPTDPGKPESAAIYLPIRGPFVMLRQHETFDKGMSWVDFNETYSSHKTESLNPTWGYVVYQQSSGGGIEVAAYHYDTSD